VTRAQITAPTVPYTKTPATLVRRGRVPGVAEIEREREGQSTVGGFVRVLPTACVAMLDSSFRHRFPQNRSAVREANHAICECQHVARNFIHGGCEALRAEVDLKPCRACSRRAETNRASARKSFEEIFRHRCRPRHA
jgi:hypothetical protein